MATDVCTWVTKGKLPPDCLPGWCGALTTWSAAAWQWSPRRWLHRVSSDLFVSLWRIEFIRRFGSIVTARRMPLWAYMFLQTRNYLFSSSISLVARYPIITYVLIRTIATVSKKSKLPLGLSAWVVRHICNLECCVAAEIPATVTYPRLERVLCVLVKNRSCVEFL